MNISLSSTEIAILERYQRNFSDRRSYVKVTCILMIGKGLSPKEVSDYLDIDDSTVYRYADSYHEDGLEVYLQTDYKGYWGMLSCVHISELRRELNRSLYTEAQSVAVWIKERLGIDYTLQETEWLETTKIKLVFLPPYFLNLIERLWKFLREKVINTCLY
ncbi:helix-turn-helix domain-containing protein [Bacteroides reticulotermitis]|nr:hypothetical protein [Bacteroides reticulotermitis]MBB4045285.1 transposase [Bacteroides reticulotermitis]